MAGATPRPQRAHSQALSAALALAILASACAAAAAPETVPEAVQIFVRYLRFKTVSSEHAPGHALLPAEFAASRAFLARSFPRVHAQLTVRTIANHSLLFEWAGSEPAAAPIALLSHQDVVPAEEGPDSPWTKPPFGGVIEGGWVYGRGAIDTKFSLVAILQAAEELLADGWRPQATIFLAFGHDEEVGGEAGAAAIARHLEKRGVRLAWLLDEGGSLLSDGLPPLTARPVALVSTAEKGFVSIDVTSHAPGGHSSRPPTDGSSVLEVMGRLLTAVSGRPPPLRLAAPVPAMLAALAPGAASRFYGYLFRHAASRLVRPVLARLLARWTPETAALVRTTVAPTLAAAGLQDNVLPESGRLTYNFRTLPGERRLFPEQYLWERLGSDSHAADVRPRSGGSGPPPAAPAAGPAWDRIAAAINATFTQHPGLLVVPNLLSGATDSRHYAGITDQGLYRFSGVSLASAEVERVHGIDERVRADDFLLGVRFFKELMRPGSAAAAAAATAAATAAAR